MVLAEDNMLTWTEVTTRREASFRDIVSSHKDPEGGKGRRPLGAPVHPSRHTQG